MSSNKYILEFRELIKALGPIKALLTYVPGMCGCVGPKNGEPLCPCSMKIDAISKCVQITEIPE